MAFQMIHMEVAYRLLDVLPVIENPAEFILGSVAPDCIHMADDYTVDKKIVTHLFEECGPWSDTQDYIRWDKNISDYYFWTLKNTRPGTKQRDFCVGICAHILTDYCNDRNIWRKLEGMNVPPMALEDFKAAYYPEARGIDQWLFANSDNREKIFRYLEDGHVQDNGIGIIGELLEAQKEHLLQEQYKEAVKVDVSGYNYVTPDFLKHFITDTTDYIANWIKKHNESDV